jgi:hypothetical protein
MVVALEERRFVAPVPEYIGCAAFSNDGSQRIERRAAPVNQIQPAPAKIRIERLQGLVQPPSAGSSRRPVSFLFRRPNEYRNYLFI